MEEVVEKAEKKERCPICGGDAIDRSTGDTLHCRDCDVSFFFTRRAGRCSFDVARVRGVLNREKRELEGRSERLDGLLEELSSYALVREPDDILREAGAVLRTGLVK